MVRRGEIIYFEASPKIRDWLLDASAARLCTIDEIICDLVAKEMAGGLPEKAARVLVKPDASLQPVGTDLTGGKAPSQMVRRIRKAPPPPPKHPRGKAAAVDAKTASKNSRAKPKAVGKRASRSSRATVAAKGSATRVPAKKKPKKS